jgi:CRP-like cAMP-binding protein
MASRCHAVLAGSVRITQYDENGGQLVVRFIAPGEIFGAVALFTDGKYPAEAVAITDSVEISWIESVIRDLMERHPPIAINMLKVLGARIKDVQERLRELATQRVECRIARALLRLAAQAGHIEGLGTKIDFPLTRKDVADMCGTTLHTASRVLTSWQEAGWLTTRHQRVTLRDVDAIRRIAEDLPN